MRVSGLGKQLWLNLPRQRKPSTKRMARTSSTGRGSRKIGISLPNKQCQHRTFFFFSITLDQELSDTKITAICTSRGICCPTHCASYCGPCQPLLRAFPGWIRSPQPTKGQHLFKSGTLLQRERERISAKTSIDCVFGAIHFTSKILFYY